MKETDIVAYMTLRGEILMTYDLYTKIIIRQGTRCNKREKIDRLKNVEKWYKQNGFEMKNVLDDTQKVLRKLAIGF